MFKLQELAELVGGQVKGNADLQVSGFCSLDNPSPTSISYLEKNKDAAKLSDIMLGALVTTDQLAQYFPDVIIVANPKLAFVSIMERFLSLTKPEPVVGYVHERAVIDPSAEIAETAIVEANVVIGADVVIGEHSRVGANSVLGKGVVIGQHSILYAGVLIYGCCEIGNHVIIHSGTVIGADGFGFVPTKEGHRKFPQVGSVLIEDHVEIGANCCIDRASLDQTVIHSGTKLDNMVQIAHGVRLGSNTVIAAQTGISGSTRVGNWCVIGGQAGFQGHITIGDQSIIAAQSGVFSDLPFKSKVSGYPAKPHAQSLKVLALTFKLPELVEKIKSLEIELDLISGELKGLAKRERRRRQAGEQTPLITPEA
ncbi:UDP-3-O-(3-hydroxymyristoyl)glucosamine N-acyltransferase [bacterium]|nr:UDP-3-O-(3-hydroxymyristoyl)glucosamine N-acyltransferase [bacterium]